MSVNVQGRVDLCSLATVAKAYIERGYVPVSRSELMGRIVDDSAIAAERAGVERFVSLDDAVEYLESVGLQIAVGERSRREVRRDLIRDVGLHDFYGEDLMSRRVTRKKQTQEEKGKFWEDDRNAYDAACEAFRRSGLVPISFEQFLENKKKYEAEKREIGKEETIVVETVDPVAFAEKERVKLAELKAGLASGGPIIKN